MKAEMIEMQLKRIQTLIRRLSEEDGTLKGIDKRLEISLDLCESLLLEALNDPQYAGREQMID